MAQYNGKVKVSVASPEAFYNATNGNGYDIDLHYGDQCWDAFALFNWSAYGQGAPTGTGYARGCWESQRNWYASHGFKLITNKKQLKDGDWVVWGGTTTGHIAMWYKGKSWSQNQQGDGSGYPFTLINMSLNNFLGAFRPTIWETVEPAPAPTPSTDGSGKKNIVLPIGITLAALAAATGLTIPQILEGDPNDPTDNLPDDTPIDQPLDDDTAEKAAENAEEALEKVTGKTPAELAQEKCGDTCKEVVVEKWTGSNNGTIWNICKNESSLPVNECVAKVISDNQENIAITAAKHNLPGDGHWIFPGETLWVQP